jgi:S-adenosylhomocysteine hydrolase
MFDDGDDLTNVVINQFRYSRWHQGLSEETTTGVLRLLSGRGEG